MPICSVDGCNSKSRANGLCNKHLLRVRLTGSTDPGPRSEAPIEERLGRHFKKGKPNSCWLWMSTKNKHGYGLISIGRKGEGQLLAHRVAWEVANGRIPKGTWVVMHVCDMPACVNPAHLKLGTQADNMRDMWAKDRANPINRPMGAQHYATELTEDDVRFIRKSSESGPALAKRYGLHRTSIVKIRSRKTWEHID